MSGVTAGTHQECSCLKKWQWSRGRASTTCSGWLRAPCRSVVCTPRSWDLWCSPGSTNRRLGKKGGTEMEGERKGSGRDRQKGKVRKWELSKQSERSDWQGFSPMRCLHTGVQHSAAQKQTSGKKKGNSSVWDCKKFNQKPGTPRGGLFWESTWCKRGLMQERLQEIHLL